MIHTVLPVGVLFQQNCAIVGDEETREVFIVDPGDEPGRIRDEVERLGVRVKGVLITHAHLDHVGAVAEIKEAYGVEAWMHPGEQELYDHVGDQAEMFGLKRPRQAVIEHELRGGMTVEIGRYRLEVLDTPGHSPASVSFYIPQAQRVIAGDTLFRRSIGRTDLPGGDLSTLLRSIRKKLLTLPPDTEVYPGHGPETTIGDEAKHNPFLS